MPHALAALILVALAACSEPAPPGPPPTPPRPVVQAEPPAPVAAPATGAQAKAEPTKADPSGELAARVKRALEDEAKVQAAAIDVTVDDGKVTLWGTAASDDERARAARVASRVQGVKAVENKIAVVRGS